MDRARWEALSAGEKENMMRALVHKLPSGMDYVGLERFVRYGKSLETGVFSKNADVFVFVPGDEVILGWEDWQTGKDGEAAEELGEAIREATGIEDGDSFLRSRMSPVRSVRIAPMLVEREAHSAGWYEVEPDEEVLQEEPDLAEELERFRGSDISEYERYQDFRLVRQGRDIKMLWFDGEMTLESLMEEVSEEGLSLMTEEEWEYLYGGGCRTLFPWGDRFDYSLKLRYIGRLQEASDQAAVNGELEQEPAAKRGGSRDEYDLEQPNFFGIRFGGDPYRYELTVGPDGAVQPKGGDGGAMLCGGSGPLLGFLPATAVYYRDLFFGELEWDELKDTLYYRRIIRLETMGES